MAIVFILPCQMINSGFLLAVSRRYYRNADSAEGLKEDNSLGKASVPLC